MTMTVFKSSNYPSRHMEIPLETLCENCDKIYADHSASGDFCPNNFDPVEPEDTPSYPDNNPKTLQGLKKPPLHLVPPVAIVYEAMAMKDGAKKYGPYNWRTKPISISTYIAAAKRHLDAYWDGEENAKDSGAHHLAHARACLALLLDSREIGILIDDRPPKGKASEVMERFTEKETGK